LSQAASGAPTTEKIQLMIIAIDGPSGAGKSTLGKMLAKQLNLLYLDTGAMYRAVGLAVLQNGVEFEDKAKIAEIAENSEIKLVGEPEQLRIFLNGKDVSTDIRTNEIGQAASIVSGVSEVRRILVEHQRTLGETAENGAVLDGRDIGSVVFPNADIKFFLTAKPEARARRRFEEDLEKGRATSYEHTFAEISERDERDVSRADSPLMIADDAEVIDTSELDLSQVFAQMMQIIEERRAKATSNLT
jgi:cytidylate kinase